MSIESWSAISRLDSTLRSRLTYIYGVWGFVLVILGTAVIIPVIQQIGQPYGGFIWMFDFTRQPPFFVSFEIWRSQPPVPTEIRFLDEIETIDGRSPWEFDQVYEQASPGDLITYVVRRDDTKLIIREPVHIFDFDKFIISHGLLYLAGLLYILSGFVILRSTKRKDFAIFAFIFLFGGSAWLGHGDVWGVHAPYNGYEALNFIFFTPSVPLTAAILFHFAAYYPQPKKKLIESYFFPGLLYTLAFFLIIGYTLTRSYSFARLNFSFLIGMLVYLIIAILVLLARSLKIYLSARRHRDENQRRILEPMIIASIVGFLSFIFGGVVPVLVLKYPVIPFEIWITLMLVVPLIFIYAINNTELIARLRREVILRQQYSDRVEDLRDIRERTLHEVADALHDQVIPELRGLYLTAIAATRQANKAGQDNLAEELSFIAETLEATSVEARAIMEGAKPVDWTETGLSQAILWLADAFHRRNSRMRMTVAVDDYDEAEDVTVKESLYWIVRAALNNIQDHARASRVTISLESDAERTLLRIADNGTGFDIVQFERGHSSTHRHLGLGNMRLRAAEILATLKIDSQDQRGTTIEVIVPRGERP